MENRKIVKDNDCLSDQMTFEKIISDLSARFIKLAHENVLSVYQR